MCTCNILYTLNICYLKGQIETRNYFFASEEPYIILNMSAFINRRAFEFFQLLNKNNLNGRFFFSIDIIGCA